LATKDELQKRIAELEVAQARAESLDQISRGLDAASEDELLQVLAWLTFAAAVADSPRYSSLWTRSDVC
jgi:hypothetical protein